MSRVRNAEGGRWSLGVSRRDVLAVPVAVLGSVAWGSPAWSARLFRPSAIASAANATAQGGTCGDNDTNDIQYLIFWPPFPGTNFFSLGIEDFVAKLGTTGDAKTRQFGYGARIPFWVRNEGMIARTIKEGFDIAKSKNVAVHFNVNDVIGWEERPELWNWYDTGKKGYNPDNRNNVEWYDWEGTPNKRRYLSPEGTASPAPQICYSSPTIRQEMSRIVAHVIGPVLREEIAKLKQDNKEHLFAGLTVGAESGIDDYSVVAQLPQISRAADPAQAQVVKMLKQAATLMDEDKAPRSKLGYCALTIAGYSKAKPPKDFRLALAEVNRQFIEFWTKQFADAGLPSSRIYTHVAASPPQDDNNNAPLNIVFNPYARPGWTTYPLGTLAKRFQPLYDELAKHGNPPWGGVEANNAAFANPNAPGWEEYLAWHFNHGAKLVGVNVGAADQAIMSSLSKGAYGDEAMAAYRKFLKGEKLNER